MSNPYQKVKSGYTGYLPSGGYGLINTDGASYGGSRSGAYDSSRYGRVGDGLDGSEALARARVDAFEAASRTAAVGALYGADPADIASAISGNAFLGGLSGFGRSLGGQAMPGSQNTIMGSSAQDIGGYALGAAQTLGSNLGIAQLAALSNPAIGLLAAPAASLAVDRLGDLADVRDNETLVDAVENDFGLGRTNSVMSAINSYGGPTPGAYGNAFTGQTSFENVAARLGMDPVATPDKEIMGLAHEVYSGDRPSMPDPERHAAALEGTKTADVSAYGAVQARNEKLAHDQAMRELNGTSPTSSTSSSALNRALNSIMGTLGTANARATKNQQGTGNTGGLSRIGNPSFGGSYNMSGAFAAAAAIERAMALADAETREGMRSTGGSDKAGNSGNSGGGPSDGGALGAAGGNIGGDGGWGR